jgi:ABC-type transport system substrate-binding protein
MKTILKMTLVLAAGLALVTLLHLALTASAAKAPGPSHPAALAPQRAAGNYGGDLRFPVAEPNNLDPSDADSEGAITGQIFEGLTRWDDDLEPLPAMAQSWESSDAQHWTFHIRHGARFHNGRQVTAQDVVYSWDRVATGGNWNYDYLVDPLLNTVTAVGTDTLEVTLNEPFALFPTVLALPFMSVVPSETVSTIYTNPVGSGPFQFQSWTAGDSIVLTHHDDYYGGRPYLDRITYQFYDNEDEM